jgi:hypothetical protein
LLAVAIIGHAFSPMVRSAGVECHGSRYLGTNNDDSTLRSDVELAWGYVIWSNDCRSGGDNTGEVQSPTFSGEKLRFDLICMCLTIDLFKALFSGATISLQGENRRSSIGR